jgi:hypothetical protein
MTRKRTSQERPNSRICPVCNQPISDNVVARQRHEKSARHMNALLKQALAKRGVPSVSWYGKLNAEK